MSRVDCTKLLAVIEFGFRRIGYEEFCRGRRPRWIMPSEICRILYIPRKPNSIIALLFVQYIFPFLKEFRYFRSPKVTQSHPKVFSVNCSIICSRFTFDVIGSTWQRFLSNLVNSTVFACLISISLYFYDFISRFLLSFSPSNILRYASYFQPFSWCLEM